MLRLSCLLLLVSGLFGDAAVAQDSDPSSDALSSDSLVVGQLAPEIEITRYVSAPDAAPTSLDALRGRWTVVEFWAAWCAACAAGVDHMNALADSLRDEPVAFVTLSADAEPTLRSFFAARPSRTWVAFDSAGTTAARYQIGGYPQAVVVRPDGRIAAFAGADALTTERLRTLVRDGAAAAAIPYQYFRQTGAPADFTWDETTTANEDAIDLYAQAVIRRSYVSQTFLRWRQTPGQILGDGVELPQLLQHAYAASPFAFDNHLPPSPGKFRVSVVASERTHDEARAMLRDALENAFALSTRWEPRPMDVVLLRRKAGGDPALFGPADSSQDGDSGVASWTGIHVADIDMGFFIESLEAYAFRTVVIDETGLDGQYAFDMFWTPGDEASVEEVLSRAGFEVVRERRDVPVLVVESAAGESR